MPTVNFPIVTVILIALNVAMYFFFQQGGLSLGEPSGEHFNENVVEYGSIPYEITHPGEQCVVTGGGAEGCIDGGDADLPATWLTLLTSIFMHGGLLHLGGNMLFLWVFGNNIEDHMGRVRFVVFYLVAGFVATFAHVALQPESTIPLVGASGAIAGVMGAYLVWFPNVRILSLFGFFPIELAAKWMLGYWFVSQFFISPNEGVAWAAHVGGFVFGFLAALAVRRSTRARRTVRRGTYA